ncbi:hypothetical protein ISCGN_030115, partial [Ixodes scapularis]
MDQATPSSVAAQLLSLTDGTPLDRERMAATVRDLLLNTPMEVRQPATDPAQPTPWKCGNIQLPKFNGYEDHQNPKFASVDYKHRLKEELEHRTQHPQENLSHFVHVIAEYFDRIGETVSDADKVARVRRQMHPKFQDLCEGMIFANLREMAKAAGGVMERAWHRLKYVPPPARTDQVARDLAFVEHHSVASNPGYALSASAGPSSAAAALAQGHPPAPATQNAGIGPQPWWPLHPAAVQASHCKTQQLATAPAPFSPVPHQLPPWTFQQSQAPTV